MLQASFHSGSRHNQRTGNSTIIREFLFFSQGSLSSGGNKPLCTYAPLDADTYACITGGDGPFVIVLGVTPKTPLLCKSFPPAATLPLFGNVDSTWDV